MARTTRTRTRTLLAAAATGLALAGALVTAPAQAATSATITLTATGGLSVSEPVGTTTTPVNLGSTASGVGAFTTSNLGTVTVTDARTGLLANTWTASVAVTDFVMQSPPASATVAQKTINAAGMVYVMGTSTAGSGNPVGAAFVPSGTAIVAANTALPIGAMTALGTNSQSWNPKLTVALTNQIAGTYAGTVTHSAA